MKVVAGIDVGKAQLDVSVAAGPVQRFANSAAGITALLRWLQRAGVTVVVCEPTGGYERQLVRRLRTVLPVVVAHPNKVRAFARACGEEAKTDRLDAQVLARFGTVFALAGTPAPSPDREHLRDVLGRRQQLVTQRVQELNRLDTGLSPSVRRSTTRHLRWLDKEIERLDQDYKAALQRSPDLQARALLYRSLCGVGELTAFLPELGQLPGKSVTALVNGAQSRAVAIIRHVWPVERRRATSHRSSMVKCVYLFPMATP